MKKLVICASLALSSFTLFSQDTFRKFKFDVAAGMGLPSSTENKGGLMISLEPKFAVSNNITLGLRGEWAYLVRRNINNLSISGAAVASYALTSDYYLNSNAKFRPFVGAGLGSFDVFNVEILGNIETVTYVNKLGGLIRVGFESSHLRLGVEYDLIGKSKGTTLPSSSSEINNNYLGVKLGVFFGGGRLK